MFDYLQGGCNVLVWGCPKGEMATVVKKYNCGIEIDDSNEEKALKYFKDCIINTQRKEILNYDDAWFTRKNCFKPVIDKIFDLLSNT